MSHKLHLLLFYTQVLSTLCYTPLKYTNDLQLNDDYHVFWYYDSEKIYFECQVRAKGWAGLGISPDGSMQGADITIGWLDNNGNYQLSDRFREGTGNGYPVEDDHNDVFPIGYFKNDTYLFIQFWRYQVTCDTAQDNPIMLDTTRLIFAYDDEVPYNHTSIEKHANDHCGTVSVNLLASQPHSDDFPTDTPPWDLTVSQVYMPSSWNSAYWCQMYKGQSDPLYLVGNEVIMQKENVDVLHHMLLYGCSEEVFPDAEKYVGQGGYCATPTMTNLTGENLTKCQETTIAVWAVGGNVYMFPPNISRPMFGNNPIKYFMLQVHYNNKNRQNYTDSSGLRLHLTNKKPQIESSQIQIGAIVSPFFQILPPYQPSFTTYAYCPSHVTKSLIPDTGIFMFGGLLHSHLLGRKLYLKQIRNGTELADIMSDDNYDFNYQNSRILPQPVHVLPGDDVIMKCVYDTTSATTVTYGGPFTQQEMCLAFMDYYPMGVISPSSCFSGPNPVGAFASLGAFFNPKTDQIDLPNGQTETIFEFLNAVDWSNQSYANSLQNNAENGTLYIWSSTLNGSLLNVMSSMQHSYPTVTVPYVENITCNGNITDNGNIICNGDITCGRAGEIKLKHFYSLLTFVLLLYKVILY